MKSNIFPYFILVLILGSSSYITVNAQTKSRNQKHFVCLDSVTVKSQMKGYEITIPDNWCSYYGFHYILSHSPKPLTVSMKSYFRNWLYVASYDNDTYKSKNIDEALSKHYILINLDSEFTPVYNSDFHKIYGKYYILKYKSIQNGEKLLNLDALFNYKNQDYIIYYSVMEKDYDKNLNEVIQIIESFRILE